MVRTRSEGKVGGDWNGVVANQYRPFQTPEFSEMELIVPEFLPFQSYVEIDTFFKRPPPAYYMIIIISPNTVTPRIGKKKTTFFCLWILYIFLLTPSVICPLQPLLTASERVSHPGQPTSRNCKKFEKEKVGEGEDQHNRSHQISDPPSCKPPWNHAMIGSVRKSPYFGYSRPFHCIFILKRVMVFHSQCLTDSAF